MNKINILGVNITKEDSNIILKKIHSFLDEDKPKYIVTPNPEIILNAHNDEELFYILNHADISLADGMGLKIAGLFMGRYLKRFTGSDLTNYLLKYSEDNNFKIAILNWRGGLSLSSDIEKILKDKFPKLKFYIHDIDKKGDLINYQKLNNFSPDILFSTLGSPWQEKNIYHSKNKIDNLKLALAVGGSFDFITGKKVRAPKIFRLLGFEWLWRLLIQPNRIKRIFNATFVFMYNFLVWRFVHPHMYRPNVACLLFKRKNNSIKIFIVNRKGEKHWQIPQGGTDGESLEKAGARELREEMGNKNFRAIKSFKNLFKYTFKAGYVSKFNADANTIEGYKGQKQGLFIAEFLGNDEDIKINFWEHSDWKWVDVNNALKTVHPVRKEALKIYLNKLKKIYEI
ncbi:MAG: WecB/TagA/CpsF family glycosyltransferase [Patescibacteria group bacterium]|jgi:N-acetylglucosaminyldiphosphoundecaprenol N-acetyl-beta-D-mannosaminyltransferase|nr:WecB/TagA/CpsF family glycosyltransferase [Patescibacteria group bacterium]